MIRIYYVRHGQTVSNTYHHVMGVKESPLTEQGKSEARQSGKALEGISFDRAFYSPLGRTTETCALILENHPDLPKMPIDGLIEWNFGDFEDTPHSEEVGRRVMEGRFGDAGGENRKELHERIRNAFQEVVKNSKDGETVLVVSHGYYYLEMLAALFGEKERHAFLHLNPEFFPVPNGGIAVIDYKNGEFYDTSFAVSPMQFKEPTK